MKTMINRPPSYSYTPCPSPRAALPVTLPFLLFMPLNSLFFYIYSLNFVGGWSSWFWFLVDLRLLRSRFMAEVCCEVMPETDVCPSSPRNARRRRRNIIRAFKAGEDGSAGKRARLELPPPPVDDKGKKVLQVGCEEEVDADVPALEGVAKFGLMSFIGRRREMEDAVSIRPGIAPNLDFFAVFDGHGCSHVAMSCKDQMHKLIARELKERRAGVDDWNGIMERSFKKMDEKVPRLGVAASSAPACRCELQSPLCDAVGSTAVVSLVSPDKIIVANCGDSRAVLSRGGKAISLSTDHKPDRSDELERIEAAGGRVIDWDCPRVLGMLAMSRAIGDDYLKPYVIPVPELTFTDRSEGDECLILASDGLWDVVSNDMACEVARACLRKGGGKTDDRCRDAAVLLTKLAVARRSEDNVSVVVVDLKKHKSDQ